LPIHWLGEVTVFTFLYFFFLFYVACLHGFQLERTGGDDFKVGATLGARNEFPFVDLFLVDVQICFAFRTEPHKTSLAD